MKYTEIFEERDQVNENFYIVNKIEETHDINSQAISNDDEIITISVKDAILVKDVQANASSQILNNYIPDFNATVIENTLNYFSDKNVKPLFIGKTIHDAFGFGGYNINVGKNKKVPLNPHSKTRVCGGSSGGSAGFTAATKHRHISIAESTGGSISTPSSYCGVIGLTPTYGMISRKGLISYGNSLDKIGIMAKNVKDAALGLEMIDGYDENDSTSLSHDLKEYTRIIENKKPEFFEQQIKIAIANLEGDKDVISNLKEKVTHLQKKLELAGYSVLIENISLDFINEYALPVYYLTSLSEASTNLAQLIGLRYGVQKLPTDLTYNEYFSSVRSENFNDETKRRIILGTFARMAGTRDQYAVQAMKVRRMIVEKYKELFSKYDVIIQPSTPNIAPKFEELENITPAQEMMADKFCCAPNLAGLPHISVPSGLSENMPTGMMLITNHLEEDKLLWLANEVIK